MSDEEALESVLSAHFAHGRLSATGNAYLYGSVLPSGILWIHAWHPLPDLAVWLAVLAWCSCSILAAVCGWAAGRCRTRLAATLPRAGRVARVQFAPAESGPLASSLLMLLAVAASALLWLHGLAPGLVAPATVGLAGKAWALLVTAAAGNRYLERLF